MVMGDGRLDVAEVDGAWRFFWERNCSGNIEFPSMAALPPPSNNKLNQTNDSGAFISLHKISASNIPMSCSKIELGRLTLSGL